jgi:hypothetical protein
MNISINRTLAPFSLLYSILAGPVLWFAYFVAAYVLAEFGCRINFNNLLFLSPQTIRTIIFVLTAAALIGVAVGGMIALRSWQWLSKNQIEGDNTDERNGSLVVRRQFLVILALCLNVLFLFGIVFTALPVFVLNVCDGAL